MNEELLLTLLKVCSKNDENSVIEKSSSVTDEISHLVGKYVIVRTRNEGINAGCLVAADETGCVLRQARRLYRPISKDTDLAWYEGVAVSGLHADKSICSGDVDKKIIMEDYSIITTTTVAEESIKNFTPNKTTC